MKEEISKGELTYQQTYDQSGDEPNINGLSELTRKKIMKKPFSYKTSTDHHRLVQNVSKADGSR